jgi:spermidine synthase
MHGSNNALPVRTYQEVADILTERGKRISWQAVRWIELRAIRRLHGKLRRWFSQEKPLCD